MGTFGLLAAVLTVVSVASLSLLSLLCLRCKKKEKIIHEEPQIYNPQIFQRGGSQFAVMRSKTVTRSKQISSTSVETPEHPEYPRAPIEEQSDYQNITEFQTVGVSLEHDYVAPIPMPYYENQKGSISDADQTPRTYENFLSSMTVTDDDDYENSEYLNQITEPDEPDYENESPDRTSTHR